MTAAELAEKREKDAAIRMAVCTISASRPSPMQSRDDMINGAEDEDLLKNYLNNYSYVSSRVNAYQFITDNDISGNLYKVCSPVNLRAAVNAYDTYDYRVQTSERTQLQQPIRKY